MSAGALLPTTVPHKSYTSWLDPPRTADCPGTPQLHMGQVIFVPSYLVSSVCVSICVCLYMPVSVSMFLSLSFFVSLAIFVAISVSLSVPVSVCVFVSV